MATCNSLLDCTEKHIYLFTKSNYDIIECPICGYCYAKISDKELHIAKTYSDSYFFDGKDGYPNYLEEEDILYQHGSRYATLVKKYMSTGNVLDVGCAAGFILKSFHDSGWNCKGIEPNDTMANYARTNLKLDVITGNIENLNTKTQFDLILMIQVIGHVIDLEQTIHNLSKSLKPGGYILIESWNMDSFVARLMGKNWHEYSPPSVINWFSNKTLSDFFHQRGFELVDIGHPVKRIKLKHAFSVLGKDLPSSSIQKRMIDKLTQTLGKYTIKYPTFDLNWYIFKKST